MGAGSEDPPCRELTTSEVGFLLPPKGRRGEPQNDEKSRESPGGQFGEKVQTFELRFHAEISAQKVECGLV
jgi:hypothetical protein